ncbi:hypothetical protein [Microbacterium testaceum]|uniref:Transcriptional regulator n=1 Tax=Microbacterium testaceum TaxID=2033 RepID=A0A147FBE5_MICTE|nr:hypothetical protein [Microbacterium testaceum]KTS13818.1 hypothetical protein RSA3_02585 [Microbacterium testaceum]
MLTSEEHRLVEYACKTWADGHVKASLAVFAMLALSSRPQWVGDVQESVREMSRGAMQPDAQTLHRMMRRLDRLGLVRCVRYESRGPGAARKIFALTEVLATWLWVCGGALTASLLMMVLRPGGRPRPAAWIVGVVGGVVGSGVSLLLLLT